jgi:hypothetical protein
MDGAPPCTLEQVSARETNLQSPQDSPQAIANAQASPGFKLNPGVAST